MQCVCRERFVVVTEKLKNEANPFLNQFRSIGHNTPCCYSDQVQLRCFIFELRPTWHDSVSFTSLSHETHYASVCSSWDDPCTCGLGYLKIIFTSSWLITLFIPYFKMVASIKIQFSLDHAQPTFHKKTLLLHMPCTYLLWDMLKMSFSQSEKRTMLFTREKKIKSN